jgi:hypothetical protein
MVYTPDGLLYRDVPYVGLDSADDVSIVEIPHPQPGVWEVDVYASHGQAGPRIGWPQDGTRSRSSCAA